MVTLSDGIQPQPTTAWSWRALGGGRESEWRRGACGIEFPSGRSNQVNDEDQIRGKERQPLERRPRTGCEEI